MTTMNVLNTNTLPTPKAARRLRVLLALASLLAGGLLLKAVFLAGQVLTVLDTTMRSMQL